MHRPSMLRTTRNRIVATITIALVALAFLTVAVTGQSDSGSTNAAATAAAGADHGSDGSTDLDDSEATDGADPTDTDDFVVDGPGGDVTGGDFASIDPSTATPGAPVDLDPVEPFAPPTETPQEPGPVDVMEGPAGDPSQSLVGNAQGCAAGCIKTALLHRELRRTDVRFSVQTDLRARFVAQMSTHAPVYDGGIPSLPNATTLKSGIGRFSWETTFEGLTPDTVHHFLVKATDLSGNTQYATTSFRTVTPLSVADDLAANPAGCTYQCIAAGTASSITHDRASLHVETSTPAVLTVSVSTQEPGWIGGSPVLPPQVPVFVPTGLASTWDVQLTGLAPGTTYHVVVRATDTEGRHSSRVGHFTTAAEPPTIIDATIRQVTIIEDGDPGRKGDGEISFGWGTSDNGVGLRNVAVLGDGDSFTLHSHNRMQFSVEADGFMPRIYVSGTEFDHPQVNCENRDAILAPFYLESNYQESCRLSTNVASTGLMGPDISGLLSCASYGAIGDWENDRCKLIQTDDLGDGYPRFWVLVSFTSSSS